MKIWRSVRQEVEAGSAKVLWPDCGWYVAGTVRRLQWLRQSEQGGEKEMRAGGGGDEALCAGPGGQIEDFSFSFELGGNQGGFWADKGQGSTQVLTGSLWLLQERIDTGTKDRRPPRGQRHCISLGV